MGAFIGVAIWAIQSLAKGEDRLYVLTQSTCAFLITTGAALTVLAVIA